MSVGIAAAGLRKSRRASSQQLAALVSSWPKYQALFAADPLEFARLETEVLVDYIALFLETGDETYRHLYTGEKSKQFFDPSTDEAERHAREAKLLAAERDIFIDAVGGDSVAREKVSETFATIERALLTKAATDIRILFVGDCLYLDVMAFLIAPALEDGIRIHPTYVTSHESSEQRATIARLSDQKFDLIFFSPLTYAFDKNYEALQSVKGAISPATIKRAIAASRDATLLTLDTLAELFECPVFVHVPSALHRHEGTARERVRGLATAPAMRAITTAVGNAIKQRVAERNRRGLRNIHLVDEAALIAPVGSARAGEYFYRAPLQHPVVFGSLVAQHYRDVIFVAARLARRKLVACDLDNTLWEGVIGEGLGVRHHGDRQDILLRLKARGVVLAINSKNDPAKVHWNDPGAKLCADDFVCAQINWNPKPMNMARIADHLNLKVKDFVFIDDRADERSMMMEQHPSLLALDALDARTWKLFGLWADMLAAYEGSDRTEFYRQRDMRQAFLAAEEQTGAAQRTELFTQLGLTLNIREAQSADLQRVTELINRTNQFNMTGGRITSRETDALSASPDARILVADAADRFGPMGTIGILIAKRDGDGVTIPYYVLSCRVFGYGMEFAILEHARRLMVEDGPLFGPFAETAFNQPCRDVYRDAGFEQVEGGWRLANATRTAIPVPGWLKIEAGARSFANTGAPAQAAPRVPAQEARVARV
jgi:FkbH-like protein